MCICTRLTTTLQQQDGPTWSWNGKILKNENSSEVELRIVSNFRKRFGKSIVKNYRKAKPSKLEYQYNDVPSFREFIEFLLDQSISNMNIHWIPIYNLCMPCHVNYNLIGRYYCIDKLSPNETKIKFVMHKHPYELNQQFTFSFKTGSGKLIVLFI